MNEKHKYITALLISCLFLIVTSYLIVKDMYWLASAFPIAIALLWMYVFRLDWVLYLIAFSTPLAVGLEDLNLGFSISMPSEPLLLGVLGIFIIKTLFEGGYNKKVLKHPVTLFIILHVCWMFFTSITSEMPIVSLKYTASRLWFVVACFFVTTILFKDLENIRRYFWFHVAGLIFVIFYTTNVHASYSFSEEVGHWAMSPFYNDHTAYGAILALMLPFTLSGALSKLYSKKYRTISFIVSIIIFIALFLSFSRAAWVSVVGALVVWLIIKINLRFRYIFATLGVILVLFFSFQHQILDYLEDNNQESSSGDFFEHVQSITNISTDASNMERINRWQSAIRMFEKRPIVGWGPGTYQFTYAPFQRSKEKTIISTNFGDVGSSHSEYLGPLSESGLPGMLFIILIAFLTLNRALIIYRHSKNKEVRMIALYTLLALTTYFLHGFLNSFLETDKLSVPVWAMIATIVSLDVFYFREEKEDCID